MILIVASYFEIILLLPQDLVVANVEFRTIEEGVTAVGNIGS
jgi:hypothetical protein